LPLIIVFLKNRTNNKPYGYSKCHFCKLTLILANLAVPYMLVGAGNLNLRILIIGD